MPRVTRGAKPIYPPVSRTQGIEGRVVVRFIVDTSGMPTQLSVHSAHPEGHFEEAALQAVGRMRFSPGRKDGRAVNTIVLLPFDFRLR